jgi:hypothetical protein
MGGVSTDRDRMTNARWRSPLMWTGLGVCWLGAAAFGLIGLMRYDNRSGPAADAPASWPTESAISLATDRPTLVMLAHPRCDCTRASLGELAELLARSPERPRAFVVFIKPRVVPSGWEQTELWAAAARIPDVTVVRDDSGVEAGRFGTVTSGQTLLYDTDGRLAFSGGITAARGKSGNSVGRTTLIDLLAERPGARSMTSSPVFGCSLFGPADTPGHSHES